MRSCVSAALLSSHLHFTSGCLAHPSFAPHHQYLLHLPVSIEGLRSQTGPQGEGTPQSSNGLSLLFPAITIWEYAPTVDTDDEKPFPFLDLPAEVRLLVYGYLLIKDGPCYVQPYHQIQRLNSASLHPNIVATCRLIRHEATPLLYGCNEFSLSHRSHLRQLTDFVYHNWQFAQHLIWRLYNNADAFTQAIGPLVRLLDRNQKRKQDVKPRNVLDGLQFLAHDYHGMPDVHRGQFVKEAAAFEKEKALAIAALPEHRSNAPMRGPHQRRDTQQQILANRKRQSTNLRSFSLPADRNGI
ncbi:hypothetical protein BST61_g6398 [Cercospora zeina]